MIRPSDQQLRALWTKRIERWKASGLNAYEFAVETGLSRDSLMRWQQLLAREVESLEPGAK